ncbi:MAG: hypothetical protein DID92_2727744197 [Candidatus Nitrotoga sp. SPKER]|nr:MAG: hypothetical protein DID92_2727744197 [Candidatus Nitrotoga sp. SPKER]
MSTNINTQSDESITTVASKTEHAVNKKPSITKNAVINAFNGLHFNHAQWGLYLADPPEWLKVCRVDKGYKKIPATWDPVCIGKALLTKGVPMSKLDEVFIRLKDWTTKWNAA